MNRRDFLHQSMGGFGALAFAGMSAANEKNSSKRGVHFPPKAKSIIYLYMEGGPSQVDLFEPKPILKELAGKATSIQDTFHRVQ